MNTVCRRTAPRWSGVLAVLLGAALLSCAPAFAVSDSDAIAMLNAQRALNGIPANLTLGPSLSDACAKHNAYIALNGGGLTHVEEPAKPGYTAEGAGLAGGENDGEVLQGGLDRWDAVRTNPWMNAPLHLWLMFQPAGGATGYHADGRTTCMRFGLDGGARAGGYSLPGGGVSGVPIRADTSLERPYSPGDLVGVSDTEAGPPIVVWRVGGRAEIAGATLASPSGAAEIRLVDSRTPALDGTPNRFGSYVLPVNRLQPGTGYTLDVVFTDGLAYRTTFTTAGTATAQLGAAAAAAAAATTRQTVNVRRIGPHVVMFVAKPIGAPRVARVRFTSRTGKRVGRVRRVKLTGTLRIKIPRGARKMTITAKAQRPYPALRLTRRL